MDVNNGGEFRFVEGTPRGEVIPPGERHKIWNTGDGPLRIALLNRIPLELRHRVKFLGFLQMAETAVCYGVCDCLLLPSDYEPWALVINEACAAGLAIVHGVIYARDHVNGAASSNGKH